MAEMFTENNIEQCNIMTYNKMLINALSMTSYYFRIVFC